MKVPGSGRMAVLSKIQIYPKYLYSSSGNPALNLIAGRLTNLMI
jgi:hypothetical protein